LLTTLDTQSWAKELVTGNAQFVEVLAGSPPEGTIYIVSNVRADNSFVILKSDPVPPSPGPGSSFGAAPPVSVPVATYPFPQKNLDFDPAIAYDSNSGLLHIVGTQNNSIDPNLSDFIKFTFDTNTNTFTEPPVILTTASRVRDGYDIVVLEGGHCLIAVSVLDTTGYLGENLLAFELDTSDNYVPGSLHIVASSPDRSGDTFSAVSLVTPDGLSIELYYGAHPKLYNFKDQFFTINLTHRISGTWDAAPTNLFTFTSRYADDSLTVISDLFGNRYLSWSFWTQSNHPEGIIGNVMLGTLQAGNPWLFNPIYGTSVNGSIVQATLSVTRFGLVSLAYLLEPFNLVTPIPAMGTFPAYPLFVATVTPTLGTTNTAGWYNQQVFTWLRGTNVPLDDASTWAFVGEASKLISVTNEAQTIPASGVVQVTHFDDTPFSNYWENVEVIYSQTGVPLVEVATAPARGQYQVEPTNGRYIFNLLDVGAGVLISYSYVGTIIPVYVSLFNVPPIVGLVPPLPLCGPPLIVYRDTGSPLGQPLTLSAAGTVDPDQDNIEYWWSDNDTTGFVTLTPSGLWDPSDTSVLSVNPLIGGAEATFNVGVAAVDLYPDLITQRHPPLNVSAYQVLLGTPQVPQMVEFTVSNTPVGNPPTNTPTLPLAVGEEVMTWDIMSCSPPSPIQSLNDQVWYVIASTSTSFTAVPLCGMSGSPPSPPPPSPPLSPVTTELASAANYAVLAYSGITNTGNTVITGGDIGSSPTPTITGFPPGIVVPPAIVDNADAGAARTDAQIAYNYYSTLPAGTITPTVATHTFTPGTYTALSTMNFTGGTVTLDGAGVYIFQVGTGLNVTTAPTTFVLINGATADDVIFVVGSAASFDANQATGSFVGTIIAQAGVSFVGGTLTGRAIATVGPVTFAAAEIINVPASAQPPSPAIDLCSGYAIPQYQFAVITVVVPFNEPPTITFPYPVWEDVGSPPIPNTLAIPASVTRNTQITITPFAITDPLIQFPVEYGGISDPDDVVTYAWSQVSGTPVTIVGASNLPTFTFNTNGVAIQGEDLVFELTLCDGINPCAVADFTIPVAGYNYTQGQDTLQLSRSVFSGNISQRNEAGTWGTVDISILYNDLQAIKRNSVNDGTDRYIVISSLSVLVYGGTYLSSEDPMVLLRKLLTPNQTLIIDAVHTEDDYTLVLDAAGNVFRYSTATFIYTDNPDTMLQLSSVSSFTYNRILCTYSFAGQRVLMFGGPDGVLLLQVSNSTLQVTGTLEISSESNLLYGANNVQFIRTAGVESLRSGQILIGTIADGQTYETLISLAQGVIIGTWNASKLKNQFVNTGEILFNPNSPYSGFPLPPANVTTTTSLNAQGATLITISWVQQRPDLVQSYNVQYSVDGTNYSLLQFVGAGTIQSITVQLAPRTYWFRVQAFSLDGTSNYSQSVTITI